MKNDPLPLMTVRRATLAGSLALLLAIALRTPAASAGPAPGDTLHAVTLEEAIRLAEEVSPSVVQAQGNVANARAQRRAARGAWLPSLTASAGGSRSFSEGTSRTDPLTGELVGGNRSSSSVNMGLSTNLELFTGFRRGADIRAAGAQSDAARADLVDTRFQARLSTTQAFLDALYGRQLVDVREAGVRRAEEQLKVAVNKLHTGTATRSDSLRSLVTLGTARLQLVDARAQQAQDEANLARIVGREGRVAALDDSSFHRTVAPLDTTAVRALAEAGSPQVQAATAGATAARASLSAAQAAWWPTLSLSADYNYGGSGSNDYQLFNQRQVSLRLAWPIFTGFSRERDIEQQANSLRTAEAQAADARRRVDADLSARLADLEAARLRIEIAGTNVLAAEEDLRVQNERYRLGAATIVDVLTSQESLAQAEVDAVNARFDYLRAKAQIESLIGRPL